MMSRREEWVNKKELAAELKAHCSEARLELLDGILADVMPPVEEWPASEIRKFLGKHVGFDDRCSLFYFLAANAFPPEMWGRWARAQKGWLKHDKSALHIANMLAAWRNGEFEGDNGGTLKTAWCLNLKQVVTVYTPNFALDDIGRPPDYLPGKKHWLDGIADLNLLSKQLPRKNAYQF